MLGDAVELGAVTAPCGLLVLGMAGSMDWWSEYGPALSQRAAATFGSLRGGHISDGQAEAVVVAAASDRSLPVRATTSPSPFDGSPTITVLEVELGLPWDERASALASLIGDLPVDRCGMVLGDARALDSFVGLGGHSTDGLADVAYWGKHADAVQADLGGERLPSPGGPRGWLDLSLEDAASTEAALDRWMEIHGYAHGLMVVVDEHTDYSRLQRAGWGHPLHVGLAVLAGARVLGIEWDQGDHLMRHRGERRAGQVYPVTVERDAGGGTVMRWTILPYAE